MKKYLQNHVYLQFKNLTYTHSGDRSIKEQWKQGGPQSHVTRKAQGPARPHRTTTANHSPSLRRTIHPEESVKIKNNVQFGSFRQECVHCTRGRLDCLQGGTILHLPLMFHYISLGLLNFF